MKPHINIQKNVHDLLTSKASIEKFTFNILSIHKELMTLMIAFGVV